MKHKPAIAMLARNLHCGKTMDCIKRNNKNISTCQITKSDQCKKKKKKLFKQEFTCFLDRSP